MCIRDRLVRGVQQLPGQALFQYRDDAGNVQPVDSGEVNDYLRAAMGESFTAVSYTHLDVYKRQGLLGLFGVMRQEHQASGIAWADFDTGFAGQRAQEGIGFADQQATAVAC